MKRIKCTICIILLTILPALSVLADTVVGKLYTMSNATAGNDILIYNRLDDGGLTPAGRVPTNGVGTGSGLGNQGAVIVSGTGEYLFAVNAGSNSVSSFRITATGLSLVDIIHSGGVSPISVAEDRGRLFVLNAGNASTAGNIFGILVRTDGSLRKMYYTMRPLSNKDATTGAAQISFNNNGRQLIVTEKATNLILTYNLNLLGIPGKAIVNQSAGATPFGFAVGKRNQVFVSNAEGGAANASTLSSYKISSKGLLQVISPEVATEESAACWVALTPDSRFAFTTNTASGNISSFAIDLNGNAVLANNDAGISGQGSGPIDMSISPDSRHLYTLNSGNQTLTSFNLGIDGSLAPAAMVTGLPPGTNGMAVQ